MNFVHFKFDVLTLILFSWTISAPGPIGTYLTIPPLKNDKLRSSTVLPYLDAYHYGNDEMDQDYYTEHDLTGKFQFVFYGAKSNRLINE